MRNWPEDTAMDIDGNVYHVTTIRGQKWMAENLKTTRFNNGEKIPLIADLSWSSLKTPGYCLYENDTTNKEDYGILYNALAVKRNSLAPVGWHVASDQEWDSLASQYDAAKALREVSMAHWECFQTDASNTWGFSALPGGCRTVRGMFFGKGNVGSWWSSTSADSTQMWTHSILCGVGMIMSRQKGKNEAGCSVRCVKD